MGETRTVPPLILAHCISLHRPIFFNGNSPCVHGRIVRSGHHLCLDQR